MPCRYPCDRLGKRVIALRSDVPLSTSLYERSYIDFVGAAWPHVDPEPFVSGFHIEIICEHLQAFARREIKNLLINVPPGFGKSNLGMVLWPAWVWTWYPSAKFITGSYNATMATRDAVLSRRLMRSDWYRQQWSGFGFAGDQNVKTRYDNNQGGHRVSIGVGAGTGDHANFLAVDDAHPLEASQVQMEKANKWWFGTMATRDIGSDTGRLAIGQRVGENDISARLIEEGEYTHVCLPMEFEPKHFAVYARDPREEPGDLLWPDYYDRGHVERTKRRLGSRSAAGQLQQRPSVEEGDILKRQWWKTYRSRPPMEDFDEVIQSWDTAIKSKKKSAWTVGYVLGRIGAKVYALDCVRIRERWLGQLAAIRDLSELWPQARLKLIEDAALADAIDDQLSDEIPGIVLVKAKISKEKRAEAWAPYLESGNILIPEGTPWAEELQDECAAAPDGTYWDRVDAFGQGVLRLLDGEDEVLDIDFGDGLDKANLWSM